MGCKSVKKIWDLLEVTHEGTNEVKHSKIDLLMSKYERFEMLPKETIEEMFSRYNDIINELGSLDRYIPIDKQDRKVFLKMNVGDLRCMHCKKPRTSQSSTWNSWLDL